MAATHYKAPLVRPGVWQSKQGEVPITRERIRHWKEKFNSLRSEGYNFPVPWGHKLDSVPTDDPLAYQEAVSSGNSGYIDRLEEEPDGSLSFVASVPPGYDVDTKTGRLVNPTSGTVICETSPGIGDWVDGQGRIHKDVILHAALCTHPVQHKQPPFKAATGQMPDSIKLLSSSGTITFTHLLSKGPDMADEKKEKPEDEKKEKKEEVKDGPGDEVKVDAEVEDDLDPSADPKLPKMPDGSDAPEFEVKGEEVEKETKPVADDIKMFEQAKEVMAKLGSPMPEDTDRNNFMERLLVGLQYAANAGASLMPMGGTDSAPIDLGVNGVPEANGLGAIGGVGTGYTFMSSATNKPLQLKGTHLALATNAAEQEKKAIADEWDKLAQVGPAAMKAIAHQEKSKLTAQFLSLDEATGKVMMRQARERLRDAKTILKASGYHESMRFLSTHVALESPVQKLEKTKTEDSESAKAEQALCEMLTRMGIKNPT